MTASIIHNLFVRSRLVVMTLVASVMSLAALSPAAIAQGLPRTSYNNSDFGAAPDSYFPANNSGFSQDFRGFDDRYDHLGRTLPRTRDPVPTNLWDDPWSNNLRNYDLPNRSNSFPANDRGRNFGPTQDYDTRYAPTRRPVGVEDLPLPPRNDWNQPNRTFPTQPTLPVQPTRPAVSTEPTLREKVEQRYADPKVIRLAQQMTQSSGEALYVEVSQYIDQRHIQPTSYTQRVQNGLAHLQMAVQSTGFQQALGIRPDAQTVRTLQQNLSNLSAQTRANDMNQAIGVMRQAGQMTSQALRVNTGVVALEFVYGAMDTLDKFSMFVAPEKSGETSVGLQSNMVGIGVEIESHPQGLKILKALAGGPAATATLTRGDIITAVDGKSVAGLTLNQAVDLIAGPNGSPVQLQLRRDNMIGDVTIVRRPFEVKSVAEVRMESGNVGYIKLDQFTQTSTKEMDDALWQLHNQGMRSLILDLRGNPGGLLTTAIEVSNRFLPSGTIVSTKGRTTNDNSQETATRTNTWKVPLVVLVDQNSASASEIFAAAVQENQRGVIVGTQSYGKGTVQTLFPMKSVASALRLTTAKFYSPNGREMAGTGVTPDVLVNTMNSDRAGNDSGLQAALRAATDPRVIDMATKSAKLDGQSVKVIRVEI